jgi:hypothetical protein
MAAQPIPISLPKEKPIDDWREQHAYGMQAYIHGFPCLYMSEVP